MKTTVVDIKGSVLTVFALHINSNDPDLLATQLTEKVSRGKAFMANAPVLIDVSNLAEEEQPALDLAALLQVLRDLAVVPIGIRGAASALADQATVCGIGLLPAAKQTREQEPGQESVAGDSIDQVDEKAEKPAAPVSDTGSGYKTKVITQPVRSGQRVFSPGDLIILSSVNAGAEVLARGNIHVYGALRGRAMAGVEGDEDVRIFCTQCNPELIAVAGDYMVNESLDRNIVNQSVMVTRDADGLIFSPLPSGLVKQ